jgi:hypothetical protein
MSEYDADGKDDRRFAFYKEGVMCFIQGEWDGGSDGDPEIPVEDGYMVFLFCTSSGFRRAEELVSAACRAKYFNPAGVMMLDISFMQPFRW